MQNPSDLDQPANLHTPNSVPFPMSLRKDDWVFLKGSNSTTIIFASFQQRLTLLLK